MAVKAAFLHGKLNEIVYMKQPEGFVVEGKENLVCLETIAKMLESGFTRTIDQNEISADCF